MNDIYKDIICVTNRKLAVRPFLEQIKYVCEKKPKAVVLREKDMEYEAYLKLAENVKKICDSYEVKFIPHFFFEVCDALRVSDIHLPLWKLIEIEKKESNEIKIEPSKADLSGVESIIKKIGVSVHSADEAVRAKELGASYLFAGHIFETDCKKDIRPRGVLFLEEVCKAVDIPVYAIGGMYADEKLLKEMKDKGAAGMAIMSDFMRM